MILKNTVKYGNNIESFNLNENLDDITEFKLEFSQYLNYSGWKFDTIKINGTDIIFSDMIIKIRCNSNDDYINILDISSGNNPILIEYVNNNLKFNLTNDNYNSYINTNNLISQTSNAKIDFQVLFKSPDNINKNRIIQKLKNVNDNKLNITAKVIDETKTISEYVKILDKDFNINIDCVNLNGIDSKKIKVNVKDPTILIYNNNNELLENLYIRLNKKDYEDVEIFVEITHDIYYDNYLSVKLTTEDNYSYIDLFPDLLTFTNENKRKKVIIRRIKNNTIDKSYVNTKIKFDLYDDLNGVGINEQYYGTHSKILNTILYNDINKIYKIDYIGPGSVIDYNNDPIVVTISDEVLNLYEFNYVNQNEEPVKYSHFKCEEGGKITTTKGY